MQVVIRRMLPETLKKTTFDELILELPESDRIDAAKTETRCDVDDSKKKPESHPNVCLVVNHLIIDTPFDCVVS